ncbi:ATP-dependent Clp protease proteolytic subunit [Streptomyces alboniger]
MDPYSKLLEGRIVFLGTPIDDISANDVMAQLMYLEHQDPDRDISLYINSPGGSFTAMSAIYGTRLRVPVHPWPLPPHRYGSRRPAAGTGSAGTDHGSAMETVYAPVPGTSCRRHGGQPPDDHHAPAVVLLDGGRQWLGDAGGCR